MDELVVAHTPSISGPLASSADGDYVYTAEGGVIAMVHAGPTGGGNQNYETPLWRMPVGSLGATPVEMAVDPAMQLGSVAGDESNAYLFIAAGRNGLWVMRVGREADALSGSQACRVDDSGNFNVATQNGLKWCNGVDFIEVGGVEYVLAIFGKRNRSKMRAYKLDDARAIADAGIELGSEIKPELQVKLQRQEALPAPAPESVWGEGFCFGLAVDDAFGDDNVYVALGQHGLLRVHLFTGLNGLAATVTDGPIFGEGSPYENRSQQAGRTLYGSVDYFLPAVSTVEATHAPFFLDVAVEHDDQGHHRVYAAVDHLGWCAFSLSTTWRKDIWTQGGTPAGYPDFLQGGERVQIDGIPNPQNKDRIGLAKIPAETTIWSTSARHLEVVQHSGGGRSLVVSAAAQLFIRDPGRMNEGRGLQWDLTVGPIAATAYPPNWNGPANITLAYDLDESYNLPASTTWISGQRNVQGYSVTGYDVCVPPVQTAGELNFFASGLTDQDKLPSQSSFDAPPNASNNLVRSRFTTWPPNFPPGETVKLHDEYFVRDHFYRLGRMPLGVFPSKIDPDLLITSKNDSGIVPDGNPIFDPVAGTITTPMATPGHIEVTALANGDGQGEIVPELFKDESIIPEFKTERMDYGVVTSPGGGWVSATNGVDDWEYRMGWMYHEIGASFEPNHSGDPIGGQKTFYNVRWVITKFRPDKQGGSTIVDVEVIHQLHITPPACKFSPLPYDEPTMAGADANTSFTAYYQQQWSGRAYYGEAETFEDYNTYVAANYGATVDTRGILFAPMNGSPQGIWAYGLRAMEGALDGSPTVYTRNRLLFSDAQPNPATGTHVLARGGLVTHPEFWNVPDARTSLNVPALVDGEFFIQGIRGQGGTHRGTEDGLTAVHNWDMEMLKLPDGPNERWILAVACGYSALSDLDPVLDNTSWGPDNEFKEGAGYRHMMVRLFDVTDPRQFRGAIGSPGDVAPGDNRDSPNIRAWTILGPARDTSAAFVKWVRMADGTGTERNLLLVVDLGGQVYLYDLIDLLDTPPSASHRTEDAGTHYGGFYRLPSSSLLITPYRTHLSVSDPQPTLIFGCEVAQETWLAGTVQMSATYVYLGVPRVGIEVLTLSFAPGSTTPSLDYIGRIQTPGNLVRIHIEEAHPAEGHPDPLLYAADYESGFRIYRHGAVPTGGQ